MISDVPLTAITLQHIEQLVENGVRENRRLDFKLLLELQDRDKRVEFLRDIVAMANADGGTILYGVAEGEGDDAGVAIALPGIAVDRDATSNLIDSLTRESIDERLTVLQHDVDVGAGRRIWIVRIPASSLAPHMIANLRTAPARFYARANTSNEPMSARQIKEAALRHGGAVERARTSIEHRVDELRKKAFTRRNYSGGEESPDQLILHFAPLFAHAGGWNYSDPAVQSRLLQVPVFTGWTSSTSIDIRFTQAGAFSEYSYRAHTGFIRDGSLECQAYDVVQDRRGSEGKFVLGSEIASAIDGGFETAQQLSADAMLPAPLLIQAHLTNVADTWLHETRRSDTRRGRQLVEDLVQTEGFVLTDWSERKQVLRALLDHVWQAWGVASCRLFEPDGTPMRFDNDGYRIPPQTA